MNAKLLSNILIGLGAPLLIIGLLFKVMHWPYSSYMLIGGLIICSVWFALSLFSSTEEEQLEQDDILDDTIITASTQKNPISLFLSRSAAILVLIGALFRVKHWSWGNEMILLGLSFGIIWMLKDFFWRKNNFFNYKVHQG